MLPSKSNSALEQQIATHPHEHHLFWALDDNGDGLVRVTDFLKVLQDNGLTRKDVRLETMFCKLDEVAAESFDFTTFLSIIQGVAPLIERMLKGGLALPDFAKFSAELEEIYREVESNEEGHQATYIPPLAEVNPDQCGLALVTTDGQLLQLGDSETDFSIQSACKPFNYCFALDELGAEKVHQHVGMEPSGQPFNARVLMSDDTGRPHNPMINAGAIMTAALIQTDLPIHRRLEHVRNTWGKLTGGSIPRFNAWMAKEEARTGDNNRALGYMMKSAGVLPHGEDAVDHELRDALELYFSVCSLEVTARELATAAATLANNGICPVTQERVLDESTVRNCLTLMQMCGMYDGSGEFSVRIGLPAKSGVGGAVFLVVPRLMGVCMWSPRLDRIGNSVRGVDLATRLAEKYRLHVYDGLASRGKRIDPRMPAARWRAEQTSLALRAASLGDLRTLRSMLDEQANLENGDYDQRTPMHLAAAEGQLEVVRFLLESGVGLNMPDRWGGMPLDDAELSGHSEVLELLMKHGAKKGEPNHVESESKATELAAEYGNTDAVVELLWAASENDIDGLRRCLANGIPVGAADYDGRTALHLAASDGRVEAVEYLLAHGHPIHVRDRWNATPLDEANREGRDLVVELLSAAAKEFQTLTLHGDIAPVAAFVNRFTTAYGISTRLSSNIGVVLDDLLALILSAESGDADELPIIVECDLDSDLVQIVVTFEGPPFDPFSEAAAPKTSETEEPDLSGVEVKIIRQLTNQIDYRRVDECNVLTLSFVAAFASTVKP